MEEAVKKILIVGAGTMGHGLAQAFAQGGYQVTMFSRTQQTLDRASLLIKSSLDTMVEAGLVDKGQVQAILDRITPTRSLEEGGREADLAIETVAENKEAKIEIFKQLDAVCPPKTLLASNTTFLNIFDFVETSRPDKVLITHWYAPPQIIPLVDVVKGPQTDEANIELVVRILKEMGKKPVVFNRPVAGYVVSRLQIAFQREVHYLLDNDYLSPKDLDEAAIWGLALRMLVIGVVQRFDFGGLDLSVRTIQRSSIESTPIEYKPKKLFELFEQGHVGVKSGRGFYDYKGRSEAEVCHDRDVRLLKLLKILQDTDLAGPVL
ncbi:MAG: 3-hydroxyacyl-CoA dehydrogenase family protein [Dehalococcoidales bacterium]